MRTTTNSAAGEEVRVIEGNLVTQLALFDSSAYAVESAEDRAEKQKNGSKQHAA